MSFCCLEERLRTECATCAKRRSELQDQLKEVCPCRPRFNSVYSILFEIFYDLFYHSLQIVRLRSVLTGRH